MPPSISTNELALTEDTWQQINSCYIAFDLETTGLEIGTDAIIEIGAVRFENGKVVSSYNALINAGVPVSEGAYKVNHISDGLLRAKGRDPKTVYQEFVDYISDAFNGKAILCAHYGRKFDIPFLADTLSRYGYYGALRFVDTWAAAKDHINRNIGGYNLEKVATHYGIVNSNAHRALSDADTCGQILARLLEDTKTQYEVYQAKRDKHLLTDAEAETYAVLINIFRSVGCSTKGMGIYKGSTQYISLLDEDSRKIYLKIRLAKRRSYLVVLGDYDTDRLPTEKCTKTEGEDNVRILFSNPFELEAYADILGDIYRDLPVNCLSYKNESEENYLSDIDLAGYSESDLKRYYMSAQAHWNHNGQWIDSSDRGSVSKQSGYIPIHREGNALKKNHASHSFVLEIPFVDDQEMDQTVPSAAIEPKPDPDPIQQEKTVPDADREENIVKPTTTITPVRLSKPPRTDTPIKPTRSVATVTSVKPREMPFVATSARMENPAPSVVPVALRKPASVVAPIIPNEPASNTLTIDQTLPQEDWEEDSELSCNSGEEEFGEYYDDDLGDDSFDEYQEQEATDRRPERSLSLLGLIGMIPGFRTRRLWKMCVAVVVYAFTFWLIFATEWEDRNQPYGTLLLWCYRGLLLIIFISLMDLYFSRTGLMSRLPFARSRNIFLRILAYCIWTVVITVVWFVLLVMILALSPLTPPA